MPLPNKAILKRRDTILAGLRELVPEESLLTEEESLRVYECDGLTAYRQLPLAVILPKTVCQVSLILRYCRSLGVKVVPRGAGTSLSGGALPVADGVVLAMTKFNRILDIDYANRCITAQPGVANLVLSQAVADQGFYYAPDPSSQVVCSIGGNVAENSGGVHCLKYGLTTNNLLGLEAVLMDGEILRFGGKTFDSPGYDIPGLLTGSEGLLAVVSEVTVRILPRPAVARALLIGFSSVRAAGLCVGSIIAAGIIPAGMEMMDQAVANAAEDFCSCGYPRTAEALLIVELDGVSAEIDCLISDVKAIAEARGATSVQVSKDEEERMRFWAGRKAAFPAVGRMTPDYYCMDGTIPRAALPEILEHMQDLSRQYGLRVVNVFHAGDGNLHPLICYDANQPGELERAEAFGSDILRACVDAGGVLTGEHGVGVEKRDLMETMFSQTDLRQQAHIKCAFDSDQLLNPGKMFPQLRRCAELGREHVHSGQVRFPDIPRF